MTPQRRGSTTGRMTAGMQSSKRIYRKTAIVEDFDSIIEYYKTHSFYATCDKFGISRTYLNKVCEETGFKKSKEQIAETKSLSYKSCDELTSWARTYNKKKLLRRFYMKNERKEVD